LYRLFHPDTTDTTDTSNTPNLLKSEGQTRVPLRLRCLLTDM